MVKPGYCIFFKYNITCHPKNPVYIESTSKNFRISKPKPLKKPEIIEEKEPPKYTYTRKPNWKDKLKNFGIYTASVGLALLEGYNQYNENRDLSSQFR